MKKSSLGLFLVLLVAFLDWMGISLVYPMFSSMLFCPECPIVPVETSMAMRGFYLGFLLAAMSIAQFFSGPILGAMSDQTGRRPLLIGSLFLGVLGYLMCAVSVSFGSLALLFAARVLVGIAAGNAAIVGAVIADLSDEKSKAKNFGLYSMACGVGFTSGSFVGGELSMLGREIPFLFAACALFANLLLISLFFKETAPLKVVTSSFVLKWNTGLKNVKKALGLANLRVLFFVILFFCFGWSFFYEFIPVSWIADYQFNAHQIGLFYSYGAAVYALSAGVLIRPIVTRFSDKKTVQASLVSLGVLFLILLFFHPVKSLIWVYLPLANFLMALLFPTSTAMVSNYVGKEAQGEILGILQSVQSLAFAISPLAAGTLLGNYPHMPFFVGSISMLFAALLLYKAERVLKTS